VVILGRNLFGRAAKATPAWPVCREVVSILIAIDELSKGLGYQFLCNLIWSQNANVLAHSALSEWNPMEEDWESHRNTYACAVEEAGVAIDGFVADEKPVCKYFERGDCRRRECSDAHVIIKPSQQGRIPRSVEGG
jgi:hypothetical protein